MLKTYDRDLRAAKKLYRLQAPVTGDDLPVFVDQNG
jgi:hypothetical protein